METFEGDVEAFGLDSRKGDERLMIRFFKKAARDDEASQASGAMRFKEVECIQIMVPGDRDNIIIRPLGEGDKRRFGQQYADWQRTGQGESVNGTPLEMWGKLTLPQIEEFRYIGVRTLEQLAELRDDACMKLPGAVQLKQKAADFLALQREEAPLRKVQEELQSRDTQIAELQEQVRQLLAAQQAQPEARPAKR